MTVDAARTVLLVALAVALAGVVFLMITAPVRSALDVDVPTGTTWFAGDGDRVEVHP